MKKIVCELCEGTVFDKIDGRFVCRECGTSYSIEEAKSMMREVEGDVPNSAPAAAPVAAQAEPPSGQNQQQLENIILLASSAYEASNLSEAEGYCNKVIELDAGNYKAWLLKGKAVGWQSTVLNPRISEASHSFCRAIDFAPEEEKKTITDETLEELKKLGLAMISLRADMFAKSPDENQLQGFRKDRLALLGAIAVFLKHGNIVGIPEGYQEDIATLMNTAAVNGFTKCREDYNKEDWPSQFDFNLYLNRSTCCAQLLREAIDASDKDDDADITRYENLIFILKDGIGACSYKQEWSSVLSTFHHVREYTLTDEAKQARRDEIAKHEATIAELKQKKQKAVTEYWDTHAEEKAALQKELEELAKQEPELQNELSAVDAQIDSMLHAPSEDEKIAVEKKIEELSLSLSNLGMFAGGKRNKINEEISRLRLRRLPEIEKKIKEEKAAIRDNSDQVNPFKQKRASIKSKLDQIEKRRKEINDTLDSVPKK